MTIVPKLPFKISSSSEPNGKKSSKTESFLGTFGRFWMTLCSILFCFNIYEVYYKRFSNLSIEALTEIEITKIPIFSREAHISNLHVTIDNRWLGHHVWLAPIWLLLIFLQISPYIRRKYLNLHRRLGKVALFVSCYMNCSVIIMLINKVKFYGPSEISLDLTKPYKVFNFYFLNVITAPYWIYCIYKTYKSAQLKKIDEHQRWALRFIAAGFGPGSMRVCLATYLIYYTYMYGQYGSQLNLVDTDIMMSYCSWLGFVGNVLIMELLISAGYVNNAKKIEKKQS